MRQYNYGARAYSIRALAAIADPCALDVLVTAAATDFAPSVRPPLPRDWEPCTGACWMQISAPPLKPKPKRRCSVSPKTRTGRFLCRCGGLASAFHDARSERAIRHSSSKWLELTPTQLFGRESGATTVSYIKQVNKMSIPLLEVTPTSQNQRVEGYEVPDEDEPKFTE